MNSPGCRSRVGEAGGSSAEGRGRQGRRGAEVSPRTLHYARHPRAGEGRGGKQEGHQPRQAARSSPPSSSSPSRRPQSRRPPSPPPREEAAEPDEPAHTGGLVPGGGVLRGAALPRTHLPWVAEVSSGAPFGCPRPRLQVEAGVVLAGGKGLGELSKPCLGLVGCGIFGVSSPPQKKENPPLRGFGAALEGQGTSERAGKSRRRGCTQTSSRTGALTRLAVSHEAGPGEAARRATAPPGARGTRPCTAAAPSRARAADASPLAPRGRSTGKSGPGPGVGQPTGESRRGDFSPEGDGSQPGARLYFYAGKEKEINSTPAANSIYTTAR